MTDARSDARAGFPNENSATQSKSEIRRTLRATLSAMTADDRHAKSQTASTFIISTSEFQAARVVMLYLTLPTEVDTAALALRAWQCGKTVVVPKVSWDQRRMLPIEITSLTSGLTTTTGGVREPIGGSPIPVNMIDLVIVPGLGFTSSGQRIGRGMGFYDRFLAQNDFLGLSCGIAFGGRADRHRRRRPPPRPPRVAAERR